MDGRDRAAQHSPMGRVDTLHLEYRLRLPAARVLFLALKQKPSNMVC